MVSGYLNLEREDVFNPHGCANEAAMNHCHDQLSRPCNELISVRTRTKPSPPFTEREISITFHPLTDLDYNCSCVTSPATLVPLCSMKLLFSGAQIVLDSSVFTAHRSTPDINDLRHLMFFEQ